MPMYQKEAMWVNFKSNGDFNKSYAVKIGAGMVNAISGAKFERGTLGGADEVQEYCHVPKQPWFIHPVLTAMVGGVLPFGAVFTELFFIMASIWPPSSLSILETGNQKHTHL